VIVLPGAVAARGVGFHDRLDFVVEVTADQRLVNPWIVHSLPDHHTGVDRIPEHAVDRAHARRIPESVAEPLGFDCFRQLGEAEAAGRVLFEGPYDQRRLLVGLEHRFAAPAARFAADVAIAVGRNGGPAALRGLLIDTLSDLLREVRRVELGDRSEDPFD
jgi:hypothetical protein